jgi:hypothetical protein
MIALMSDAEMDQFIENVLQSKKLHFPNAFHVSWSKVHTKSVFVFQGANGVTLGNPGIIGECRKLIEALESYLKDRKSRMTVGSAGKKVPDRARSKKVVKYGMFAWPWLV